MKKASLREEEKAIFPDYMKETSLLYNIQIRLEEKAILPSVF